MPATIRSRIEATISRSGPGKLTQTIYYDTLDNYSWMLGIQTFFGLRPFRLCLPAQWSVDRCTHLPITLSLSGCLWYLGIVTSYTVFLFCVLCTNYFAAANEESTPRTEMALNFGAIMLVLFWLSNTITHTQTIASLQTVRRMGALTLAVQRHFDQLQSQFAGAKDERHEQLARLAAKTERFERLMSVWYVIIVNMQSLGIFYFTLRSTDTRAWYVVTRLILVVLPYLQRQIACMSFCWRLMVLEGRWNWLNALLESTLLGMEKESKRPASGGRR